MTKSVNCDDFRGITINPILSKVFEYCILDRFGASFVSCEAQFGFKKNSGCRTAIYSVRKIVDRPPIITFSNTLMILLY